MWTVLLGTRSMDSSALGLGLKICYARGWPPGWKLRGAGRLMPGQERETRRGTVLGLVTC